MAKDLRAIAGLTVASTMSRARRSLSIDVVDAQGHHTRPGADVRVYAAGAHRLISSGLVDTGGGYCSQSVMPARVATASAERVDAILAGARKRAKRKVQVIRWKQSLTTW
jgi:hypothetical protein